MKKIIGLLIFGLFLLFSSNSIFADAFDDCFELERLRAKSDGLGAVEAAEQASQICKAKLGGTQRQELQTPTKQNNTRLSGGFYIGVSYSISGSIQYDYVSPDGRNFATGSFGPVADIRNGLGYQIGYRFSELSFSYEFYDLEAQHDSGSEINVENSFIAIAYNKTINKWNGFIGFGVGTGKGERIFTSGYTRSGSGSLFAGIVGLNYNINENIQLGVKNLRSFFTFIASDEWEYTPHVNVWFLNGTISF